MAHGHYEETRVAVAFGDIAGFTAAYERATSPLKEIAPFFQRFDALLVRTARKAGLHFEDTGDGYMCPLDLSTGHNCEQALSMLSALWDFNVSINAEIEKMEEESRFRFFRTRVAAGYVLRKVSVDGKVLYRGKPINLAHNSLEIHKDEMMVCHGSFRSLISDQQLRVRGFTAEKLARPRHRLASISNPDLDRMFALRRVKK